MTVPTKSNSCRLYCSVLLDLYSPVEPLRFGAHALSILSKLVDGHLLTFDRLDFATGTLTDETAGDLVLPRQEYLARWGRYANRHPIVLHHLRMKTEGCGVYDLNAVFSETQRRAAEIESELFRPLGIQHQLAAMLPSPDAAMGISISRDVGSFSDEDRHRLELVAPHIRQAWRNSLLMAAPESIPLEVRNVHWDGLRSLGYSRRECDVLEWLAQGKTDEEIAAILSLSKRTVSHHVLTLLEKFGAANRVAVVTSALRALQGRRPSEEIARCNPRLPLKRLDVRIQAYESALMVAQTPAAVCRALRTSLSELWSNHNPCLRLVRLGLRTGAASGPFPPLRPEVVRALTDRFSLVQEEPTNPRHPGLDAAHELEGAVSVRRITSGGYLWEDYDAEPGHLFAALVLPEENLALAVSLSGSSGLTRGEQDAWHLLAPHVVLSLRNACRLVKRQSTALMSFDIPPPQSPQWQNLGSLGLTNRQGEVLAWVAAGQRDEEIASTLGLSRRTVNAHLRAAFGLLGVENRTTAVLEICQHMAVEAAYAN